MNLDSYKLFQLKHHLSRLGIDFVSDIQANRIPPIDFALSISGDCIADLAGKGQISRRQMKLIQSSVQKDLDLRIEWIVTPSQTTSSIEAALHELLERKHPGAVSAVFISQLKITPVSVWIERNQKDETRPDLASLETVVEEFLKLYEISDYLVSEGSDLGLPTNPMLLRKLKQLAPVTIEGFAASLWAAGSGVSNLRWLQLKLDTLRKHGLLFRSKTGEYCLTELGLGIVPHGKNRTSSDVERALALGRRKW